MGRPPLISDLAIRTELPENVEYVEAPINKT